MYNFSETPENSSIMSSYSNNSIDPNNFFEKLSFQNLFTEL